VLIDQRMPELPLGAGDLEAVSLERSGHRTVGTKLLALRNEKGDALGEELGARAAPASPEARRAQVSESGAACHGASIGRRPKKMNPHMCAQRTEGVG
jgi:hypothetical protein